MRDFGVMYDDPKVGDEVEVVVKGTVVSVGASNSKGVEVHTDKQTFFSALNEYSDREFRLIKRASVEIAIGKAYQIVGYIYSIVGEDDDKWVFRRCCGSYGSIPKTSDFWDKVVEIDTPS